MCCHILPRGRRCERKCYFGGWGPPCGFYKSEAGIVCMNGCVPWHPSPLWVIISWSLLSKGRSESCTPTHRCGRWSIVETVIKQTHFPPPAALRALW